jgi:hypothetical protein
MFQRWIVGTANGATVRQLLTQFLECVTTNTFLQGSALTLLSGMCYHQHVSPGVCNVNIACNQTPTQTAVILQQFGWDCLENSTLNPDFAPNDVHFLAVWRSILVVTDFRIWCKKLSWAVPWLGRLAAGLPPRRPGFDPGSVHVGFVVDKVTLGQVFLRVLRLSRVNFIRPLLHY